jgi:hypothetical protein
MLHILQFKLNNSHALHPRWPPLLKIDISSNGQNCFILSQNVPKFELYKHNDELFNIVSFIICLFFRPISALIIPTPLGTLWLKIEQFWPFEEISIFNNGGHLVYRTAFYEL